MFSIFFFFETLDIVSGALISHMMFYWKITYYGLIRNVDFSNVKKTSNIFSVVEKNKRKRYFKLKQKKN